MVFMLSEEKIFDCSILPVEGLKPFELLLGKLGENINPVLCYDNVVETASTTRDFWGCVRLALLDHQHL